jgi:hypothetical protein
LGIKTRITARAATVPRRTHDNADLRLRRFFKTESLKFIPFSSLFYLRKFFAPAVCKTPLLEQHSHFQQNIFIKW